MSSSTTVRKNRFFATKVEAIEFKKKHGGAMYARAKYSKTKRDYYVEVSIRGLSEREVAEFPYVVAWNSTWENGVIPKNIDWL